jgi:hypothetical protein
MNLPFALQDNETVLLFCRRHIVYLVLQVAKVVFWALLPVIALTVLLMLTVGYSGGAAKVALLLSAVWLIFWGIRGYFTWYKYQHDIWVITNQRIIDSLKRHWFHHRMASADLVDIEDIAVVREGLFPTAFNFGDLRCQTAGEVPNFILSGIPKPSEALAVVDKARDAARRELGRPALQG